MNKNKIIGNPEEQKGIEKLLRQAGQDRVINEVIEGKDPDAKFQGVALFNDEERGPYFSVYKGGTMEDYDAYRVSTLMKGEGLLKHTWLEKPVTYNEILEKALELWGDEYDWLENLIKQYIVKEEKPKADIGFYDSHYMPSGLATVAVTFKTENIPLEAADCLCQYPDDISLPPIVVVQPNSLVKCQKKVRKKIEANPETHFYITSFIERGLKNNIGEHENVTYFDTSDDLASTMLKILEKLKEKTLKKLKQYENGQRS